ncbi:hypothetical protein Pmar_PMAR021538 [Perkinsus marinus ATCC 50983]|uniref:Uncharacterized protein n=1 Tax=Perkinsus marinus (strain ATCC 50983 / TXsc) TaxID=423536 RepID=C5LFW4_PERM5|nr:hypothetical protein Pmar_PMAR021538 [Perkinsus marinus ATCC 50983]EER04381.1 hypothetical protein Pmar_PMAR021538 [Perkinsus marinus ATCC 50983]|eukprot:XP_002772565.1 hypothetical protein Pmar_PMAR021538 [Perkinsus marinus ATCC 50983]
MEHHHAPTTPESSKKAAAAAMRYAQWRLTPSSTGSDDDTNRAVPSISGYPGTLAYRCYRDGGNDDTYRSSSSTADDRLRFFAFSALEELSGTMRPNQGPKEAASHLDYMLDVTRGDEPSSPGDELPDDDDKTTPSSSSSSTSPSPIAPTSHEDHHDAKETAVEDTSTVWQDRLCARWDVIRLILVVMCPLVLIAAIVWLVYDA